MATLANSVGMTETQWAKVGEPGTDTSPATADFLKLKGWVKASLEKHSDWYREARECFDVVAGRAWLLEDEQAIKDSGRVPVNFNYTGATIDAIGGMEVNNRQEVKFLPRTQGDVQKDENLSSLAKWARDDCMAEDEESDAFRDLGICGRGCTETRLDFNLSPTGKSVVERVDPLECGVDPGCTKSNFDGSRFRWRFRDLDTDDGESMFPGTLPAALDAKWARSIDPSDGGEGNKRDYPDETRSALMDDKRPKSVRVVQIQWWEQRPAYMVAHPLLQPEPKELAKEQWEPLQAEAAAAGYKAAKVYRRTYWRAFLGRDSILGEAEQIDCFTLEFMTGKLDRNKGTHYGVVRPMIDPQRLVNKVLTQVLHILNSNAKGGLLAEKGAFSNVSKAEQDWSDPSKIIWLNDGALSGGSRAKITNREPPEMPAILTNLLQFAISAIRDVVGTNVEMLGMADREQPASLEYQRRQSAMTILATLFSSLRRYRKAQGKVLVAAVLKKLPPGVLVRVMTDAQADGNGQSEPQEAYAPFDPAMFGLDNDSLEYDVIVDESPSSPNQKEAIWAAIQPFLEALARMPQALKVALKYSPLPAAAAQELGDAISGEGNIPPEVQQMISEGQQQIQQLTQENQSLKGDHTAKLIKAQADQYNAETDRVHKVGQLQGDGGHSQMMEAVRLQMEQQREESRQQFDLILKHLDNLGKIEVARIAATKGTADQNAEQQERADG